MCSLYTVCILYFWIAQSFTLGLNILQFYSWSICNWCHTYFCHLLHSSTTMVVNAVGEWTSSRLFSTHKIINCCYLMPKVYVSVTMTQNPNWRTCVRRTYLMLFVSCIVHGFHFTFHWQFCNDKKNTDRNSKWCAFVVWKCKLVKLYTKKVAHRTQHYVALPNKITVKQIHYNSNTWTISKSQPNFCLVLLLLYFFYLLMRGGGKITK